jgi:hypothetical protein
LHANKLVWECTRHVTFRRFLLTSIRNADHTTPTGTRRKDLAKNKRTNTKEKCLLKQVALAPNGRPHLDESVYLMSCGHMHYTTSNHL